MEQTDLKTELSGQCVLPGFQEILNCEAATLKNPKHERFCVEFVRNGGDTALAWQGSMNPECSRLQAQMNASKLLKNGQIRTRIAEISAVMRNRSINEVMAFQRNALNFDPADYFDPETGRAVKINQIPELKRKGVGLEARIVDGQVVYLPVFPSPQKAAESLAKMIGIEKQILELTGKDGGPIEVKGIEVSFVKPDSV